MVVLHLHNVTSVQLYFGPTCTFFFSRFQLLVGPMNCISDTHAIEKKLVCILPTVSRLHAPIKLDADLLQAGCTPFVGQMNNLSSSDNQRYQVGCTTFLGQMQNFCRSDANCLQVGCTTFLDRIHNFCRSDALFCRSDEHIVQVRCTHV